MSNMMERLAAKVDRLKNDERGEANTFAVILGVVVVALVIAVIAGMLVFGANTVDQTGRSCVSDPENCAIQTG